MQLVILRETLLTHAIREGDTISKSGSSGESHELSLLDRMRLFLCNGMSKSGGISTTANDFGSHKDALNTSFYNATVGAVFADGNIIGVGESSDIGARRKSDGTIVAQGIEIDAKDQRVPNNAEVVLANYKIKGFYWKPTKGFDLGSQEERGLGNFLRKLDTFKNILDAAEVSSGKMAIQLFRSEGENRGGLDEWLEKTKNFMPIERVVGAQEPPNLILNVERLRAFFDKHDLLNEDGTTNREKFKAFVGRVNHGMEDNEKILGPISGICEVTDNVDKISKATIDFNLAESKKYDLLLKVKDFPTKKEHIGRFLNERPQSFREDNCYHTSVMFSPKNGSMQEHINTDSIRVVTVGITGKENIDSFREKEKNRLQSILNSDPRAIPMEVNGIGLSNYVSKRGLEGHCFRFISKELEQVANRIEVYGIDGVKEVSYGASMALANQGEVGLSPDAFAKEKNITNSAHASVITPTKNESTQEHLSQAKKPFSMKNWQSIAGKISELREKVETIDVHVDHKSTRPVMR